MVINKLLMFGLFILLLIICAIIFNRVIILEKFSSINDLESTLNNDNYDNQTITDADILIKNSYDLKSNINVTDDGSYRVWWHYPIFKLGSYAQITNNLKYYNNPDIGRCTPTEFCGSIYKNKKNNSNYIQPLPPIDPSCGTRIGYFTTNNNLLPFRNDSPNILY
jgi:hypothetical protein